LGIKEQETRLTLQEHDDDDDDSHTVHETEAKISTVLGITRLDKEKNQCIRQKTGAQNIVKEIKQYQNKWLQHVQRMETNRLPKQALQYKPKGRRNIGRPRKRRRDQLHLEDQGTGNTPNPSRT
jgi:hypothetical protein